MPTANPYFMPADMEDNAPGPGETQIRVTAIK